MQKHTQAHIMNKYSMSYVPLCKFMHKINEEMQQEIKRILNETAALHSLMSCPYSQSIVLHHFLFSFLSRVSALLARQGNQYHWKGSKDVTVCDCLIVHINKKYFRVGKRTRQTHNSSTLSPRAKELCLNFNN